MIRLFTYDMTGHKSSSSENYYDLTQRAMYFMNVVEEQGHTVVSNSYQSFSVGNSEILQRFVITYRTIDDEKFNLIKIENEANRRFNQWKKDQNKDKKDNKRK